MLRWLREAAGALDTAHEAGVVHRDIKPGNLLLDDHDRLAVADFGIARVAWEDQLTATGQVLGTAAYLSPEQALGEPATAASDRYALAVVAYELLVGARPFDAEHFAAQARAHVEDPVPPASSRADGLSRAVDAVLERGLAKEPADRWDSAAQFVDELDAHAGTGPRGGDAPDAPPVRRQPRAAPERPDEQPRAAAPTASWPPAPRHEPYADVARDGGAAAAAERARGRRARRSRGGAVRRRCSSGLAGLALIAVIAAVALASRGGDDPEPRRPEHAGGDGHRREDRQPTETATRESRPTRRRRSRPRRATADADGHAHARPDGAARQRQAEPQGGHAGPARRATTRAAPATSRRRWPRPARPSSSAAARTS